MSSRRLSLALGVSTLLCGAVCAAGPDGPAGVQPSDGFASALVKAPSGLYQGTIESEIHAFKGVAYAQPPIGDLRWKPPVAAPDATSVVDATKYGPACAQNALFGDVIEVAAPKEQSEDCLKLDVWSPARAADVKLPVMVWIHGGWFSRGSARQPSGGQLAKMGNVVVVGIDYRLGPFGFLAHPLLAAESSERSSGNYGLLDQIAALRWVRRNIEAFGGDLSRVTIFGQSAGGISACYLLASPLAKGLFQGAIMQSGACEFERPRPAAQKERLGLEVSKVLRCDEAPDVLACLRAKSTSEILSGLPAAANFATPVSYTPNRDGYVLPGVARQLIETGGLEGVRIMIGSTADDASRFLPPISTRQAWIDYVNKRWPRQAAALLDLYPAADDAGAHAAALRAFTDIQFGCAALGTAQALASHGAAVYLYRFSYVPEFGAERRIGAYHGAELPYVFANLRPTNGRHYGPIDVQLSQRLVTMWSRFAADGSPNDPSLPEWPRFAADSNLVQEIGLEERQIANPEMESCKALQSLGL